MNAKINKNRSGILKRLAFCSSPTLEERALWELRSRSGVYGYGNTWDKALYRGKQLWTQGSGGCAASRQQMESHTRSITGDSALEKDTHWKEQGSKLRYPNVDNNNRLSRWPVQPGEMATHPSRPGWEPRVTPSPPTSYRSSTLQYPDLENQGSITWAFGSEITSKTTAVTSLELGSSLL